MQQKNLNGEYTITRDDLTTIKSKAHFYYTNDPVDKFDTPEQFTTRCYVKAVLDHLDKPKET